MFNKELWRFMSFDPKILGLVLKKTNYNTYSVFNLFQRSSFPFMEASVEYFL